MRIGPKYKIARRLGAQVFEKTQGKKFAIAEGATKGRGDRRPKTDFGIQMLEKQKVRFTYGIIERQFKNMVKEVLSKRLAKPEEKLFENLESRLDNVVLRGGLAHTRFFARQMVSHGHITVNGKKVNIPSFHVKKGDVISVREGSKDKGLFANLLEKSKDLTIPAWLRTDFNKKIINVEGAPIYVPATLSFSLTSVLEFYRR